MKYLVSILTFAVLGWFNAEAQTVYKTYIGKHRVAIVIVTHNKEYLLDTNYRKSFHLNWAKETELDVIHPDPNDTLKYGKDAINGVIRYTLDDKKYPKAYSKLSEYIIKCVGPANMKAGAASPAE